MGSALENQTHQTGGTLQCSPKQCGSVAFDAPAPAHAHKTDGAEFELLAPEEAILDASCAFDALARRTVLCGRAGLTKTQTDIVMDLALFGSSSMTELSQNLAVSKEHISRAVAALSDQGLVEKRRSSQNFRVVKTELTAKGSELSKSIRSESIERLNEPLSTLSAEEREELIQLAARATELLCKVKLA